MTRVGLEHIAGLHGVLRSLSGGDNPRPLEWTADMPLEPCLLLSLADHGDPPGSHVRCLNIAGRWAAHSTPQSPWLVWATTQADAAGAAAQRASLAHGRQVEVVSRHATDDVQGCHTQTFTDAFDTALQGAAPQSAAKARRLRIEADKLEAFCLITRTASAAADHDAFSEVSRAAAKALKAKFGGGSITSAFAWLAGRSGREALESVLMGDVELAGGLSVGQVVEAVALAQEAERLREEG